MKIDPSNVRQRSYCLQLPTSRVFTAAAALLARLPIAGTTTISALKIALDDPRPEAVTHVHATSCFLVVL